MAYHIHLSIAIFLLAIIPIRPPDMRAQSEPPQQWQILIEQWAESQEDISEEALNEIYERYNQLLQNPINLNDTIRQPLRQLPFITPFQCQALYIYIELRGSLLSINELMAINGFDANTIALLRPICTTENLIPQKQITAKALATEGHHNLTVGGSSALEQSQGYTNGNYQGNPLRLYLKYQYNFHNRIILNFSAKKDAGEAFFGETQPLGFDFYNGNLQLNDIGFCKKIIVGRYNIRFGQGLTQWNGMGNYGKLYSTTMRTSQALTPAPSYTEYDYMQGIATSLQITRHWDATLYASYAPRDATKAKDSTHFQSISKSGYHRTISEIEKKNNIHEFNAGARLQYSSTHVSSGLSLCTSFLSDSILPSPTRYNYHSFTGDRLVNYGWDGIWRINQSYLFGEIAGSGNSRFATIAGLELNISANDKLGVSYRYYAPGYHNLHCTSFGENASAQNEEGFNIHLTTQLPKDITLLANTDFFRSPDPKYNIYAPSFGQEYQAQLSYPVDESTQFLSSYSYRSFAQNNTQTEEKQYLIIWKNRHRASFDYLFSDDAWSLRTKIAAIWFSDELGTFKRGFLLMQHIQYTQQCFSISGRITLFDSPDYETRLYCAEQFLTGDSHNGALYGKGCRAYLLFRWNPCQSISFSLKYDITRQIGEEKIGTGNETITGDHRQFVHIQLSFRL